MSTNNVDRYSYRVRWSNEDDGHIGTVAEFPSLSWIADTSTDALIGIQRVVQEILQEMERSGEEIPKPIGERTFSGKFMVRIPEEAHRALALEAAEQNVSLNRLVSSRLS